LHDLQPHILNLNLLQFAQFKPAGKRPVGLVGMNVYLDHTFICKERDGITDTFKFGAQPFCLYVARRRGQTADGVFGAIAEPNIFDIVRCGLPVFLLQAAGFGQHFRLRKSRQIFRVPTS
jgi:hypothetical protein